MKSISWLPLSIAGTLLFLSPFGLRGQEAQNPGRLLRILEGHSRTVNDLAFSSDRKRLVSASDGASVRIWGPNTCAVACTGHAVAQVGRSGNPILPGWYADPEAHVFENEYWIYPTYSAPYDRQTFM